jgi:DNA sulfur modification protein DndD
MEIRITGWGYENIRGINNLDIDLVNGNDELPHTTLVMMSNGTGKTTTLQLMRAAFSGVATTWDSDKVNEYKPIDSTKAIGKFYVKVNFGVEKCRFTLILDYENGKARYETSRVGIVGGLADGYNLPSSMNQVLNSTGFVERFIFDGEQAKKTLKSNSKEAELAIWYLYRIDKLEDLKKDIEHLIQEKQSESDSKGSTPGSLSNNRTRMDRRQRKYNELKEKQYKLHEAIDSNNNRKSLLTKQKQDLLDKDAELKDQQKQLNNDKKGAKDLLNVALQKVGYYTRQPYYVSEEFNSRLHNLVENMQTLKLPKTTAREFFKELSESKHCVCGREIGPNEKAMILQNAELYLGEDDLSAINAIKDKLRNYSVGNELKNWLQEMLDAKGRIQDIQSSLNRLDLRLDSEAQEKAEKIKDELEDINEKLVELNNQLRLLEDTSGNPDANEDNNLQKADKACKEATENFQRAQGTYEYTQKANKLLDYITRTENIALEKLKRSIIEKTNIKIAKIITTDHIVVKKIDGNIILEDRAAVSDGQTLAIAYSYIGSLFEHSSYEFPFVVDSPAAPMDLDVRRMAATIIPQLFKQLIIFVTSGEVRGFAEKFYQTNDTRYLTIVKQGNNKDALCHEGKGYFAAYQDTEAHS